MKSTEKKLINLRGFVVIMATVTGLGLPVTGIANHLLQSAAVASISRHISMSAHTILGVLFMVSAVWHAILNRRILLKYALSPSARLGIGREAAGAIILVTAMLLVGVAHAIH